MKRFFKRVLALGLVLILLMCSASGFDSQAVTAASSVKTGTVSARIDKLYKKLGNTYFTTDRTASTSNAEAKNFNVNVCQCSWFRNVFGCTVSPWNVFPYHYINGGGTITPAGWTCAGFASFAEWYIFSGCDPNKKVTTKCIGTNYANNYSTLSKVLKPGDILRYGKTSSSSGNKSTYSCHSAIVVKINKTGVYVLDANWCSNHSNIVSEHYIYYSGTSSYNYVTVSRATNHKVTYDAKAACSSLSVGLTNAPTKVTCKKSCNISGKIKSDCYITKAQSWITDSNGKVVGEKVSYNPYTKSIDIKSSKLNQYLKFSSITKAGKYKIHIYAKNTAGRNYERTYKITAVKK